ncbi:MAG: hypothetical protein D6678_02185 [Zetaproteobacteria bacterium]|nr:MAG: hypothetical protein D6678_02185 [Zetaproteobacteria bacterium]
MRGYTLVELLVAMLAGVVILGGIVLVYVSAAGSGRAEIARNERMGDLYLASQIMQGELRTAQGICWNATNAELIYQPLDSTSVLPTGCDSVASANGAFRLDAAQNRICWDRPSLAGGCQELIRDLDGANGLQVAQSASTWTISLQGRYIGKDRQPRTISLSFKVRRRN